MSRRTREPGGPFSWPDDRYKDGWGPTHADCTCATAWDSHCKCTYCDRYAPAMDLVWYARLKRERAVSVVSSRPNQQETP